MSDLRITAGPFEFGADWEAERAPKTCAAFEALLPFRNKIIHVRWSGESAWIPLGDLETGLRVREPHEPPRAGRDPALPGRLQRDRDPVPVRRHAASRASSGQLAGNHFLTVTEGREQLRELGRTVLWEGAQDIVFET